MIRITDKHQCCGCSACVQVCSKQCIDMQEDGEGFCYPVVNTDLCVHCGLCEKVCPCLNDAKEHVPLKVLAAFNAQNGVRLQSSSGGVFSMLAESAIKDGGVVFGARFDTDWNVRHDYTESMEGLAAFRGSKYVQSLMDNSYQKAKTFLNEGRKVLFTGTPCQIAGLNRYLRKEYDNLLTVDVACHGVPSPGVWKSYLYELSNRLYPGAIIKDVVFRDKRFGWKNYHFTIKIEDEGVEHEYSVPYYQDWYMLSFLKNLILRPSCSSCPVRNGKSGSDLTIGDFWGIEELCPEIDDDLGTSIILVNTLKGGETIKQLNNQLKEIDYSLICDYNPCFVKSFPPHPLRDTFFRKNKNERIIPLMKLLLSNVFFMRMKRRFILNR